MADEGLMKTSELLRRAWEAVQESGVPESIQAAAFAAAAAHERQLAADVRPDERPAPRSRNGRKGGKRKQQTSASLTTADAIDDQPAAVDEGAFFAKLSSESSVDESDLRDVLSLSNGTVHVTPPTRKLGTSTTEQARHVIALVAGARSFGLGERPVDADAVRTELDRKRCYQRNHFAERHLGALRGFNAGANQSEIVTTSKWVDEFAAAVNFALSRTSNDGEG